MARAVTTRDEARMTKPPRPAPNFRRNLARTITLADGRQLKSLHDARELVLFGSVNARSGALGHAIILMLAAAESGGKQNIAAATDQIERVLRDRRLM